MARRARRDNHIIIGVHLTDRITEAVEVQKLFTAYGGYIETRLGLHEVEPGGAPTGSKNGMIILGMVDAPDKAKELADKLNAIRGVEVKTMTFTHTD